MLRKRLFSAILAFILIISCTLGIFIVKGEDTDSMIERILVTYEELPVANEFSADSTGLGASYLSPDSLVKVVGNKESVVGSRSLAVSQCDMRWWTVNASDDEMNIGIVVKVNENFRNTFDIRFATKQPSGASGSVLGSVLSVTRKDNKSVLLDASGNIIKELENDVRYNIKASFKRGENEYDVYINNALAAEKCSFICDVYDVESLEMRASVLPPEEVSPADPNTEGSEGDEADSNQTIMPETEQPYILIDNPCVSIKGRSYPQKYSSQEPGAMPDIKLPGSNKSDDIRVFINTQEIAMSYAPVLKNGTVYVDVEQIARCVGMQFEKDNSNKTFTLKNDNADIKGTIGGKTLTINGRTCELKAPPEKIESVVMVPINFLNEAFNAKVWWDESNKMLVLTTGANKKDDILKLVGSMLYMNGEPYYEISFNKFDLFYQIMSEYVPDRSYPSSEYTISAAEAALKQLHELGFKSIRAFVYSGAFPHLLYEKEWQDTYFEAMDIFFDLCDKYDIKVVVCLGLIEPFLLKSDYIEGQGWITSNETTVELVANPQSESRANVYKYLDMVINRYKDRKSVLMWEIRNEGILEADIGDAARDVRYSMLQLAQFYGDCADKIRSIDDKHLITSGDSVLRNAQWNLLKDVMAGQPISWKTDTAEERLKALCLINEKLDVISAHAYGLAVSDTSVYTDDAGEQKRCDFKMFIGEAARLGKAFYNGETNGGYAYESPTYLEDTQEYIDMIINSGVQLSHWWTFRSDRQGFNDGYTWRVDSGELLDMLVEGNKRIKEVNAVNKASDDNTNDVWDDPSFEVFSADSVIDGSEFVAKASFRSKMIRLAVICGVIVVAVGCGVFVLTREKLKKKRKTDIV